MTRPTRPTDVIAIDIETTGLSWGDRVLAVAAAWWEGDALKSDSINLGMRDLFNTPATTPEARAWLQGLLEGKDRVVFHSGSFDIPYLVRSQLIDPGQLEGRVFDTLVMARCTAPHPSVSLINLCKEYGLPVTDEWETTKRKRGGLETANPGFVKGYAEQDARSTLLLYGEVSALAKEQYTEGWIRDEGDFVLLVSKIRARGIPLNLARISALIGDRTAKKEAILRWLAEQGVQGPYDRTALPRMLSRRGYPIPQTEKGNPSLDKDSMEELYRMAERSGKSGDQRLINAVLKGRHWEKQLSTWLEGFLEEADDAGRIHPNFSVGGTMSFRLSCSNPNAQAVPSELGIFHPGLTEADYGQVELRLAALFAGENGLARIFAEEGADPHEETAKLMFPSYDRETHRPIGKSCNYLTIYGGGKGKLAEAFDIAETKAASLLSRHRRAFPAFPKAIRQAEKVWIERGYLNLAHGKRLWASEEDLQRSFKAFNNVVQASVAEIVKKAMLEIDRHVSGAAIISQGHDSLVLEWGLDIDRGAVLATIEEIMADSVPPELTRRTTPEIRMKIDFKGGQEDG